ncbi:hypothetical protein LZ017_17030 [Pelomonas sp. CA6]|uniref:TolB family protein n=1 Tax=Pelomonas sp. CA6 TaxID=2907999 RepID=UPI001F4BD4A4|nr:hypothetical protein [Pelomonas sp. CA6]MCH7345089.1 hypothetical protein [Pelomonas sp. CA6]
MLIGVAGGLQKLTLASGTAIPLPPSAAKANLGRSDYWYGSGGAGLVRKDSAQELSFVDPNTLAVTGTLNPASLAGTDLPDFVGPVRMSPDGRHLLGYFRANYRSTQPTLTVMARDGRVVMQGSSLSYDRSDHAWALDWLPDGRFVYLADKRIVVSGIDGNGTIQGVLDLPANISTTGAALRSSPDGKQLLLTLGVRYGNTYFNVLFIANLDGTGLRQLTRPTDAAIAAGVRLSHANAVWSPDGRWVAFAVRGVNPATSGFYEPCQPLLVIPSDTPLLQIDGAADPAERQLTMIDGAGNKSVLKECGSIELTWW